jgi:hypothetical protein
MNARKDAKKVLVVADKIAALLSGLGPEVQGGILADMVSRWLAGHMLIDEPGSVEVEKLRKEVLVNWLKLVFKMTPANEAMLREAHGLPPSAPPKDGMN